VVTAGDRTRLVLNLKAATGYKAQLQGKSLLVSLDPVAGAAPVATATSSQFAENRNRDTQPIKDLDFRRGPTAPAA
jgi:type IV pilus assembly protein PilQ